MYITEILKLRNFSGRDIISDCEFLLSILNAFTANTEKYCPKCYMANDAKTFKSSIMIAVSFTFGG